MAEDVDTEPKKKNDDDGTKKTGSLFTMKTIHDAAIVDSESHD